MKALKLTCPNCQYQTDFMSALQDNEQREFLRRLVQKVPGNRHVLIMRYLNMFKPAKYAMSFSALNTRLEEVLAMVTSGKVIHGSNMRAAPQEVWFELMEQLTNNKPDSLKLPLKSHGYLKSMVFNEMEHMEAEFEAKRIEQSRNRPRMLNADGEACSEEALKEEQTRDDELGQQKIAGILDGLNKKLIERGGE